MCLHEFVPSHDLSHRLLRKLQSRDVSRLLSFSGNISAVFTYKWKGEDLARLAENNSKVYVHITIASQTSSRTANINRWASFSTGCEMRGEGFACQGRTAVGVGHGMPKQLENVAFARNKNKFWVAAARVFSDASNPVLRFVVSKWAVTLPPRRNGTVIVVCDGSGTLIQWWLDCYNLDTSCALFFV